MGPATRCIGEYVRPPAEFLKRKEALIPIRQKRFSRKRKNPSRNRKPGCRREAEGVQYPVWIYRKVMKHRFAAR
jgi:hypothetical protein